MPSCLPLPRRAAIFLRFLIRAVFSCVVLTVAAHADALGSTPGISERPLAARTNPQGKTMFTLLSPESSGVKTTNNYADPKMWGQLYQEFLFGAIGTGVAIGDYDGDGLPDIFVVSKTESCRLFRNLGNYKFEDVTEKAGVADHGDQAAVWKQGVTFVDINNDGLLDIYVCRFNAPNLLYINQGDGTFKEQAHAYGLDVKDACGMASFCDYDRDGYLDVYLATNLSDVQKSPRGQRGYLFHNNRNGTFTNVTDKSGIYGESQSHSATWWDFDNDGWPDLYVANDYGVPDKLYRNNRDGTFTNVIDQVAPHTSFSSMGSDLGDVNNDGLIDFFIADMAGSTHRKYQRSAAEIRGKAEEQKDTSTTARKYGRNALLINTGTGRCLEAAYLAGIEATDWTWSVRFEDLDNDGRVDLFATNGMNVEQNIDINAKIISVETPAERIAIMRTSPPLRESHYAYRNKANLQFEDVSAAWGLNQIGISFGAALGDLSGDGNIDIIYSNYKDGPTLLRNDCETGHRIMVSLRGSISNRFGIGATVRIETAAGIQVRQLWLARGYMSSSEPVLHFGLGDETVIKQLTVTWPSGLVQEFHQLAADRHFTINEPAGIARVVPANSIVSRKTSFTEVSHLFGLDLESKEEVLDENVQQALLPLRSNRRGPALAVASINNDDSQNIFVGGTTLTPATILSETTASSFRAMDTKGLLPLETIDDGPALFFDAKGDGTTALLITKGGTVLPDGAQEYQPRLYYMDGKGGFTPAPADTLPTFTSSAGAVAAADFDHDGRLDLFIGGRVMSGQYPLSPHSALFVNRDGKFEDVTDQVAPVLRNVGMVTSALWTDVDGDGWADLLITVQWGTVKYFHNNKGQGFEDWSVKSGFAAAGSGWWNSIAAADFNGDGQMDYVVGNLGLNTHYRASVEHPALLYYGDFKGEGSPDLIEAYYDGGKLYPFRSLKELARVLPGLRKRYRGNDQYAEATLNEIVGPEKLQSAQRFEATEFQSGVFMSQSDGSYKFEPLPRIAQISPMQGIAAGDFDGDGYADIYTVQNSYAPAHVVGRFDGGLSQLLKGDGHGHFTEVTTAQSGLVVPGNAKALVVLDLDHDGRPDFLVSRNNDHALAFRNEGVAGQHFLRVNLRGPKGNMIGIGSRVTVELADHTIQTAEVSAASGYYSQSTSELFFGFTDHNPARLVRVRWPSGQATEQALVSGKEAVTIFAPK